MGRASRLWLAGFVGACLLFLAAILAVPRLDTSLRVALYAFVIALPLLGFGFLFASADFGPAETRPASVDSGTAGALIDAEGLRFAAWVLGEGVGCLAVLVGVIALIWHLSVGAAVLGVVLFLFTPVAFVLTAWAWADRRARRVPRGHPTRPLGDAGDPPPEPADGAPQG
jgi:hypothetical protein